MMYLVRACDLGEALAMRKEYNRLFNAHAAAAAKGQRRAARPRGGAGCINYKTGWFFRVSRRPESNELYLDVRASFVCFEGFAVTNLERGARSCL